MRIVRDLGIIMFLFMASGVIAQPTPVIPPDPPSAAVPITGIEWLLISGGLFGAGRIYKNFKNRQ